MDTEKNKLRFTVDRIEENIAVCICDSPILEEDGTETELIVRVPADEISDSLSADSLSDGDIFDAFFDDGVFSEIVLRPDIREMRMEKNRRRLRNLFNRNKNQ